MLEKIVHKLRCIALPFPVCRERRTVKKKRYLSGVALLSVLILDGDVKKIKLMVE